MDLLYPTAILEKQAKLWLEGIRRRLGSRQSVGHPYYGEISRDIPHDIFKVIVKIVRGLDGFGGPFCVLGNNKRRERKYFH